MAVKQIGQIGIWWIMNSPELVENIVNSVQALPMAELILILCAFQNKRDWRNQPNSKILVRLNAARIKHEPKILGHNSTNVRWNGGTFLQPKILADPSPTKTYFIMVWFSILDTPLMT